MIRFSYGISTTIHQPRSVSWAGEVTLQALRSVGMESCLPPGFPTGRFFCGMSIPASLLASRYEDTRVG